jgi:glutathione S-transferase
MIVLHTFGKQHDMIDPSPFVSKAHALLRFAGLPYEAVPSDIRKAPRGKFPVIVDDGETICDSTLIRFHIEKKYGFDFDAGLDARDRAIAWSVEKMLEDHLVWIWTHERWTYAPDYANGPVHYFRSMPAVARPLVELYVNRKLARARYGQGVSRFTDAEREKLSQRGLDAVATILGDKPFLMGDAPCGADATLLAFMNVFLCPVFTGSCVKQARAKSNLVAYSARLAATYFPDFPQSRT